MRKIISTKGIVISVVLLFYAITISLLLSLANHDITSLFAQNDTFVTYKNSTHGIEIHYPSNWRIIEEGKNPFAMSTDVVILPSPSIKNISKSLSGEFRISVQNVNMTLEDFTNKTIGNLIQNTPGAKIIESNKTTLAGNPAHIVMGMFKQENKDINVIDEWAIKNEKLYRITFYSEQGSYSKYLPTIQKMIDSFVILK